MHKVLILKLIFRFLYGIFIFLFLPNSVYSNSNTQDENLNQCNGQTFNEINLFVSDYLNCLSGEMDVCAAISDLALYSKTVGAGANTVFHHYLSQRLLNMAATTLRDAKALASDKGYKQHLKKTLGGSEVDSFVKKFKGDESKALTDIQSKLKLMDPEDLRLTPDGKEKIINNLAYSKRNSVRAMMDLEEKLSTRVSLHKDNSNLINDLSVKLNKVNSVHISNLSEIDQSLDKFAQQLNTTQDQTLKQQLNTKINKLKDFKVKTLSKISITETTVKEIAEAHNKHIDSMIENLQNNTNSNSNSSYTKESIKNLKKKKIKVPKETLNNSSRLIIDTAKSGFSVVDVTGKWRKLPEWAQDLRLSQFREMPHIVRQTLNENPALANDLEELVRQAAIKEHERYRVYTEKRLVRFYNAEQGMISEAQMLRNKIDNELGSQSVSNLSLSNSSNDPYINNHKRITRSERIRITVNKGNWLKVDVPFSELSNVHKYYTTQSIVDYLKQITPEALDRSTLKKYEQTIILKPFIGKASGALSRSVGWGTGPALAWYDMYDYADLTLSALHYVGVKKDFIWDHSEPQCRLPTEMRLGAKDPVKLPQKYLCHCQSDETPIDKLPKLCQMIPSLMDRETKKYCELLKAPGRDKDLYIAKAYQELGDNKAELKKILKSGASCEVMKNQNDNCRFSTDQITQQGLYFLKIMKEENLFEGVAQICPDVCSHWMEIALKKLNEFSKSEVLNKFPNTKEENKTEKDCSRDKINRPPPLNRKSNEEWHQCQPKVVCLSPNKIRVNISKKSRYEIDINKYNVKPQRITNYFQLDLGATDRNNAFHIGNPLSPISRDTKNFMYTYDDLGQLKSLVKFDLDAKNGVDQSYLINELDQAFGSKAFNTLTNTPGLPIENYDLAKRLEAFLTTRKAIDYCCANEINCDEFINEDSPMDLLNEINQHHDNR